MTLTEFAQEVVTNWPGITHCFINVHGPHDGTFYLEVEAEDEAEIAGCYDTQCPDYLDACEQRLRLTVHLTALGVSVFDTYVEWLRHWGKLPDQESASPS